MATKKDYYEILGVSKTATVEEIKKAYRALARKFHPDINKEKDATDRFKEINEAYQVLTDEKKREAYDRFGHSAFENGGGGQGGWQNYNRGSPGVEFNFDFGNFRDPFEIFEEFFGVRSPYQRGRRSSSKGEDKYYEITLPFAEAVFGVEKTIELDHFVGCSECQVGGGKKGSKMVTCTTCHGKGQVSRRTQSIFGSFVTNSICPECGGEGRVISEKCPKCKGAGRVREKISKSIKIPSGVDDGDVIRFPALGDIGEKGAPAGDLFLTIRVLAKKEFKRSGFDIYSELPLSFGQAALGDTVAVETVHGPVKLKIPTGTQTGTEFRLKGYGVPRLQDNGKGDHLVKVIVKTPQKLSKKQEELLKEFF